MTRPMWAAVGASVALATVLSAQVAQQAPVGGRLTIANGLDAARPSETVTLTADDLRPAVGAADLRTVRIRDSAGVEILTQAIDANDDGVFEALVFQTDLGASETRTFQVATGERRVYTREQFRAYGRFVRERYDDFAWENDRVAFRMYGAALETWVREPLTSSAVDVWFKRTPRLVINDWYMVDDYHRDLGDGADLYSAGRSRGCGGHGVWEAGQLWTSANFRGSRVLANGPIRVMFELTYLEWPVNGRPVSARTRVTLDAGQHLNRFEVTYGASDRLPREYAAGIKKGAGSVAASDVPRGLLHTWEPVPGNGNFGCGVVMPAGLAVSAPEVAPNYLLVGTLSGAGAATYYAGAAWDRGGHIRDAGAWAQYLQAFTRRLGAPVSVRVTAQ